MLLGADAAVPGLTEALLGWVNKLFSLALHSCA